MKYPSLLTRATYTKKARQSPCGGSIILIGYKFSYSIKMHVVKPWVVVSLCYYERCMCNVTKVSDKWEDAVSNLLRTWLLTPICATFSFQIKCEKYKEQRKKFKLLTKWVNTFRVLNNIHVREYHRFVTNNIMLCTSKTSLTLTVLVTTIDALRHFQTG